MNALMPRLFGDMADWFEPELPRLFGHMIRIEDLQSDHEYLVRAELPGLDPEKDIQVSVDKGLLTIRAERREEEQSRNRSEFRYGALQRSVRLPASADEEHVSAKYAKGVLEITIPLAAAEPAVHRVPITTTK